MNVCFFNRCYWPDETATGQLLTELAEDLVIRHGCEVTVVTGPAVHASRIDGGLDGDTVVRGVRVIRTAGSQRSPHRFTGRAANYLTYFASATVSSFGIGKPDVVVSLTDPPIIGLTALWAARRAGARFVFLSEDVFPNVAVLLEDFRSEAVNRSLDRVNRYLLAQADAVIAVGERMRQRLVDEKSADPARVHVIHNWADCSVIVPGLKDNPFARAHGLADRFVVMHSGNVGLSQNLEMLIEAADRLRTREHIVVAIVGHGGKRATLEEQVRTRGLRNVIFLPYQQKAALADAFGAADAFLVSLKAGLEGYIVPSKVYGILAAGRPYVAATDPSCEAAVIAREHHCGVVTAPGDPDALAAAILRLHDDPAATALMGARARQAAAQFDRHASTDRYFELFARVAGVRQAA